MLILQASNIRKQYGERVVLDFQSLRVYKGERVGVVGGNGAGKSTLLGILCGDITPDTGRVERMCDVAVIRQLPENEGNLSGGENAKRQILSETGKNDRVVFADEPTANLDEAGVRWMREKLLAADTVLLVSHDRRLLREVCTRIIEVADGGLRFYSGGYDEYVRAVEEEKARQEQAYEENRRKRAQLERAVGEREQHVARQRQKKRREYAKNSSEARLGGHKRAASMKQQQKIAGVLQGRLERLGTVEKPRETPKLRIDFARTDPPVAKTAVSCTDLHFAYGGRAVFRGASFTVRTGAKVAITGDNGTGKTTLLRLLYEGCDAVRPAPGLHFGYLHQSFDNLLGDKTVLENAMEDSVQDMGAVRGVLAGLLFTGDDVHKRAGVLSGGEKLRLSLAKLIVGNYNALLLDEPTNYLDLLSMQAVEGVLRAYPGTLLFTSHDRAFLEAVADEELCVGGGRVLPRQAAPPAAPVQRTVLELRRQRLLSELSSAPPERKEPLEAALRQVVEELRAAQ